MNLTQAAVASVGVLSFGLAAPHMDSGSLRMTLDNDLAAARVTVVALHSGFRGPGNAPSSKQLSLNGEAASEQEIVRRLAMMPKPLVCSASVRGSTTALRCESLKAGSEREGFIQLASETAIMHSQYIQDRSVRLGLPAQVVYVDGGEPRTLSAPEYAHWVRSYVLDGVLGTLDAPTPELAGTGSPVALTFRVTEGDGIELELGEPD